MGANAIDLTTAAVVAEDLGIASSAKVERVVTAASRMIATHCGRKFERATGITEYPAGYGRSKLLLERMPIVAITSITECGAVVDASGYEFAGKNADAGIVFRKSGVWMLTARAGGRITDTLDEHDGESGDNGITVVYEAGYVTPGQNALNATAYPTVTAPEDLQTVAELAAVALYKRLPSDPNVASEGLGDWNVSYRGQLQNVLSSDILAMLEPYVRRTF